MQNPFKDDTTINAEIIQMRQVKNNQNMPSPEPNSTLDSSSPDSSSPEAGSIPDKSLPEAGSIPDESSPEADSIPDKWRIIVNRQFIKAMTKKLLKPCR